MSLDLIPNEFVGYRIKPDFYNYTVGIVRRHGPNSSKAGQEYFKPLGYYKNLGMAAQGVFNFALKELGAEAQVEQEKVDRSCASVEALASQVQAALDLALQAVAGVEQKFTDMGLTKAQALKLLSLKNDDEGAVESEVQGE